MTTFMMVHSDKSCDHRRRFADPPLFLHAADVLGRARLHLGASGAAVVPGRSAVGANAGLWFWPLCLDRILASKLQIRRRQRA